MKYERKLLCGSPDRSAHCVQAVLTQGQTGKSLHKLNVSACSGMNLASLDLGRTVNNTSLPTHPDARGRQISLC